jgi:uncharacterized protein YjeT (DUF2065 family)
LGADLGTAFGLVPFLEGLLYAAWPQSAQRMMAYMQTLPPEGLRKSGLIAMGTGVFLVWIFCG